MGNIYTSQGWVNPDKREHHHYGCTLDLDTPTTGVLTNNKIDFLSDAICDVDTIDLSYEEHKTECRICNGDEDGECDWADGCNERGTLLIGDWKKDEEGLWVPDEEGSDGYAAIVRELYTQVVWSKRTIRAKMCSPCFLGQGDAETEGDENDQLCYTLPEDFWEKEDK